ncbi:MAG: EamA family transporter RarD [Opitutaceae bacterium]|nr:EamA family transporter RarD [Cephaloticoccus sp.]MCP5529059.1 EamA family transporter RarD [Opitutaceae bacterium]
MKPGAGQSSVRGGLAALACYLAWGIFPVYWYQLASVDAVELIAHRLFWTMAMTVPLLWWRDGLESVYAAFNSGRIILNHALSGGLLTINWLVFVWAVNNGHVIETSLGYFLVPLVNIALGWSVLREKLRRAQWLAIAFAAAGVAWQLWQLGRLPWIALALAGTFGTYGLLRKRSTLGSLPGLTVETLLLAPLAGAYLMWCTHRGTGALGFAPANIQLLVLTTGIVTATPLLLFAYGARRLRLTTLGLLQYAAPTVQFALGLWFFAEPFSAARAQSFVLIWIGLAIYTGDALRHRSRSLTPRQPTAGAS